MYHQYEIVKSNPNVLLSSAHLNLSSKFSRSLITIPEIPWRHLRKISICQKELSEMLYMKTSDVSHVMGKSQFMLEKPKENCLIWFKRLLNKLEDGVICFFFSQAWKTLTKIRIFTGKIKRWCQQLFTQHFLQLSWGFFLGGGGIINEEHVMSLHLFPGFRIKSAAGSSG